MKSICSYSSCPCFKYCKDQIISGMKCTLHDLLFLHCPCLLEQCWSRNADRLHFLLNGVLMEYAESAEDKG